MAILLLLLSLLTSAVLPSSSARLAAVDTNTDFIKTSCTETIYPTLCYSSLSSHASTIQQNPKLLAGAALSISLDTARSTAAQMVMISSGASLKAPEIGAMRDCVDVLGDTVDRLKNSMAELNGIRSSNFVMVMSDVQTWVSAALTDEDTCMDGFAGKLMNGATKTAVRGKIVYLAHITSNALALINNYAAHA